MGVGVGTGQMGDRGRRFSQNTFLYLLMLEPHKHNTYTKKGNILKLYLMRNRRLLFMIQNSYSHNRESKCTYLEFKLVITFSISFK